MPVGLTRSTRRGSRARALWFGAAALGILGALGSSVACSGPAPEDPGSEPLAQAESEATNGATPDDLFVDATAVSGLDFVHQNGATGRFYYSEMMGGGGALLDYDNDGDLDLFLVQSGPLGDDESTAGATGPPGDRLYRNDLGPDGPRFVDVSSIAGFTDAPRRYGMGAVAADFDGDGWSDLYVTAADRNRHWRNRGDGTFEDVTDAVSGIERWSVPAAVADYDLDGRLDLFVGQYVDYQISIDKRCTDELGRRNYCGPLAYAPLGDALLRNVGGRFEDATGRAGIGGERGATLGAVWLDADGDSRLDLFVANDGLPNVLWRALGDGRFENDALTAGVALNAVGHAEASMGVAAADFDHDGDEDLVIGHLDGETNTLYRNNGRGAFDDRSTESRLGAPSFDRTAFGTGWLDVDGDGWLDLVVVNGAVKIAKEAALDGDEHPLRQGDQLFRNRGDGRFDDWTEAAGAPFRGDGVSRGALLGDLDNDGDTDLVIVDNGGPARLLLRRGAATSWLGLRLVDPAGSDVPGALAELERGAEVSLQPTAEGEVPRRAQRVTLGSSYASSSDPRLLFRFDRSTPEMAAPPTAARVTWPDGRRERFDSLVLDSYTTLRRGTGEPIPETSP